MSILSIPYDSELDNNLADRWTWPDVEEFEDHWCAFVKGLDTSIVKVEVAAFTTDVEFATDADKTMFLLRFG